MCDCVFIFIEDCGNCIGQSNCPKYISMNKKEGEDVYNDFKRKSSIMNKLMGVVKNVKSIFVK